MTFVSGASSSLRKNIKRIKQLIADDIGASASPRHDYDGHFDALIKKAYSEGFKKAHREIFKRLKVPKKLKSTAKTPASEGKQEFEIVSRIKKD